MRLLLTMSLELFSIFKHCCYVNFTFHVYGVLVVLAVQLNYQDFVFCYVLTKLFSCELLKNFKSEESMEKITFLVSFYFLITGLAAKNTTTVGKYKPSFLFAITNSKLYVRSIVFIHLIPYSMQVGIGLPRSFSKVSFVTLFYLENSPS